MNLETKLRKWYNEFDTVSFNVVVYFKKLEELLNDIDIATDFNQDLQKYSKPCNFIKIIGDKQPEQRDDSILNLCDIFEVCRVQLYGERKVDTSYEIDNEHFCKMVDLLIRTKYYNVNDKAWDDTGLNTPLYLACVINEEHPNVKCIEMLLENGADPNIKIGITGDTILHCFLMTTETDDTTCLEVIRLFVNYGFDITTVTSNGYTLLHTCAKYSRIDLIEPLIELGVDITLKDVHGRDAFHVYNVFHILLVEDFLEEVDSFEELINLGFEINQRDSNGCTILMLLIYLGAKTDKLAYILHKGCAVNAVDKCGRTALHYVFTKELELCLDEINVLIDAGADYLIKDKFQKTAFHYIVYKPQEQQLQCLCYLFTHYRQLFNQIDLKLRLNEIVFLSRYNKITKQLTELLSFDGYRESTESYLSEALHILTEKNVSDILNTKGIGALENLPEFQPIHSEVDLVMQRLATQLSKQTPFKFKVQCSGSVSEKCKVGLPDEFDYLFIIEGMEKYFEIQPTQTPCFASIMKKTVKDFSEEFSYFVNECGYMVSACFLQYFGQNIFEVLQTTNIWEGTELCWFKSQYDNDAGNRPAANFLVECRYHVPCFKDIDISIDVVPALPIPQDKLKTFFANELRLDSPDLLVLPTKSYRQLDILHQCRISTSFIETSLISSLPRYLRNAFMLLKILNEHGRKCSIYYHYLSTTYHLKTVLLHTSSKILEINRNVEHNSNDIKLIFEAANIMINQYSKFKEDENIPSYFFKTNLLENL